MTSKMKDEPKSEKKQKRPKYEVRFYEGYKKAETPHSIIIDGQEFKIQEIIWRKRVRDAKSGKTSEVFKCKIKEGTVKIKVYESGRWSLSFS